MEKVYKKIAILSIMIVALSFTACGDDGKDVDNGKDVENGSQYSPSPSLTRRLTKVSIGNWVYNYTYYNDGRIKEIRRNNNSYSAFTYKDNQIIEDIIDYEISYQKVYTIENGKIVELYDNDTNQTYSLKYNNDYLISAINKQEETLYNWSDGNLSNVIKDGRIVESYEYSNYKSPEGFFPFVSNVGKLDFWGINIYFGKTMKNLPSKYKEGAVEEYDWIVDNGLPIKMIRTVNKSYDTTFAFEWE